MVGRDKLLVMILLCCGGISFAQTDALNHQKYWYYRWRIENNFMKQGKLQGESCIANQRGTNNDITENRAFLKFGDQTITQGIYLATLALEYNLLALNNQSTTETVKDLYYSLYAINRLDENVESLYGTIPATINPSSTDFNGFLSRDDVNNDFLSLNQAHLNNGKVFSQVNNISNYTNDVQSDWISDKTIFDIQIRQNDGLNTMSKDQIFYIMLGLSMVQKYVPEQVVYSNEVFQDGTISIHEEAEKIMRRIIRYANGKYDGKSTFYPWNIKNPLNGANVARGHSLWDFCFPVGLAACNSVGGISCGDFYNTFSSTSGLITWGLYVSTGGPYLTNNDNKHMFGLMMALSGYPNTLPFHALGYTSSELYHIPLVRQVLYGGVNPVSESVYLDLLNSAPCEGPYYFTWNPGFSDHNSAAHDWSTSDRILHPQKRAGQNHNLNGEYPGVDYMFYHNLFYTVQNQYYNNPVNLVDNYINTDLPFLQYGTTQNPMEANIFNSIEADNTIAASNNFGAAKVTYRAGHSIRLKNGFNAQNGATFHAYTDPFSCASDGQFAVYKISSDSSADLSQHILPHYSEELVSDNLFNFDETDPEIDNKLDFDISAVNTHELFEIQSAFNNIPNDLLFSVYPNPAVNELMLSFKISEGQELSNVTVQIFDMLGRKLDSRDVREIENSFDISSYPSGIYVIKIAFENGLFYKEAKFIKQ